jgi:hypothetical protein
MKMNRPHIFLCLQIGLGLILGIFVEDNEGKM